MAQIRNEQEDVEAQIDIWKLVFGFVDMAGVRCAIELDIPKILENQAGRPITLSDLSSVVGSCSPTSLQRLMRFLVHRRIFDKNPIKNSKSKGYVQTRLSSLLIKIVDRSLAAMVMMQSSLLELS
ncbi:acetylserotonin O-methyltransferase-like [Impatiens glandulifera]|uniref:acetylserotonin O-methyltransferase-like n=1 Tax=Impatiens glandulifera TaxID=253017 RepID=UPI001FB0FB86|nr:acetylserotonin O-methyltransferase-like [Impatiens glandulifera]